jgi:hypothetical protein
VLCSLHGPGLPRRVRAPRRRGPARCRRRESDGGCQATPSGEEGWTYECAEVTARVIDDERRLEADPSYLGGRKAAAEALVPGLRWERERARLGGRDVEVLRGASAAPDGFAFIALVALPQGTRILDCVGRSADRCRRVLDALASVRWRDGAAAGAVARAAPGLRIGGRPVDAPEGCRPRVGPTGAQFVCPGGYVAGWGEMPDEEALSRALRAFREKVVTMAPWPSEPEALPCRISGVDASCLRLSVASAGGQFVAIWGGATIRGVRTIAFCTARGGAPIPSPCSSVFEPR